MELRKMTYRQLQDKVYMGNLVLNRDGERLNWLQLYNLDTKFPLVEMECSVNKETFSETVTATFYTYTIV